MAAARMRSAYLTAALAWDRPALLASGSALLVHASYNSAIASAGVNHMLEAALLSLALSGLWCLWLRDRLGREGELNDRGR